MYKTIIKLKTGISDDVLQEIKNIVESAFDNREGVIKNTSDSINEFHFEADEKGYGCLHIGMYEVEKNNYVKSKIHSWDWIDEDPDESCDMLEVFSTPVVM